MTTILDRMPKEKQLNFAISCEYDTHANARVHFDDSGDSYFEVDVTRKDPDSSDDHRRAKCTMTLSCHLWDDGAQVFVRHQKTRTVSLFDDLHDSLSSHLIDLFPTAGSMQKWVAARELEAELLEVA